MAPGFWHTMTTVSMLYRQVQATIGVFLLLHAPLDSHQHLSYQDHQDQHGIEAEGVLLRAGHEVGIWHE